VTQQEKIFYRIKNNPTNVRFATIEHLLITAGFSKRQTKKGSSHICFKKNQHLITIPKSKPIKECYVKDVIALLEKIKEESNE